MTLDTQPNAAAGELPPLPFDAFWTAQSSDMDSAIVDLSEDLRIFEWRGLKAFRLRNKSLFPEDASGEAQENDARLDAVDRAVGLVKGKFLRSEGYTRSHKNVQGLLRDMYDMGHGGAVTELGEELSDELLRTQLDDYHGQIAELNQHLTENIQTLWVRMFSSNAESPGYRFAKLRGFEMAVDREGEGFVPSLILESQDGRRGVADTNSYRPYGLFVGQRNST